MNSIQDLRYGIRLLLKDRSFALIAVLALALGIGANSAIFSVVNALVLKPLPFENLDRLIAVRSSFPNQGLKATAVSAADFEDWRSQNNVFKEIAAYRVRDITITGTGEPEMVRGSFVSADFFSALDLRAVNGRTLLPDEDRPGGDPVVVLGYGLWQRRFGADPNIPGTTITLSGRATTVVGIMPPDFDFPFGTDLWMPLALTPQQLNQRDTRNLQVLAQLKVEVTVPQAQAEMLAVAGRLEQQYPKTNTGLSVQVLPLRDQQSDFTRPLMSVLSGMSAFLLLIACANVANLLFARATTRQREIAIRSALGASRWRLIRQMLTESFLLSGVAGMAGLILSLWSVELIKAGLPPDIARFMTGWKEIEVDGRVLLFTLGLAFLTTLVFSIVPALQASRPDLNEMLKDGNKSSSQSWAGGRARRFLVASEIALALVLLVGAGLMVKGFSRILNALETADPASILTLQTPLPDSKYKDSQKIAEFYQQVVTRMRSLPGVEAVSVASNTPLNNRPNPSDELIVEGRPPLQLGERQPADVVVVSRDYFATIGAPLLKGRDFEQTDDDQAATPVAIISQAAAQRYWPNEDPIGRRIKRANEKESARWLTIVGVVTDVKQAWFDKEIRPQLYLPYLQAPAATMSFLLSVSGDPMSLVAGARSQVFAIDRDQPIEDIKTLQQLFVDETSPFRFAAVLMSVFGGIALVLAAVGVYGVMSYSVAQRTHEIGIRMALGAGRSDVLRLITGQGLRTAAIGLTVGFPLALALSRIMVSRLFGVVSLEFPVLVGLTLLMGAVAFLSSYIPARRATKVDPIVALRSE